MRWKSAKLVFHLLKFKKKKNISTILKFVHDRLQKRGKEQGKKKKLRINLKERFGTNGIKTKYFQKNKKYLPLPFILLKAPSPPPKKLQRPTLS